MIVSLFAAAGCGDEGNPPPKVVGSVPLTVQVNDASNNNQPAVGATVLITEAGGGTGMVSGSTDANGRYGPVILTLGTTYNVSATGTSPGGQAESAQSTITMPSEPVHQFLTLTLAPPVVQKAQLIVLTQDESTGGLPLPGVLISVFGATVTPPPLFQGTTDATGAVAFTVDTGRTYNVTWTLAGYQDLSPGQSPHTVTFPANSTTTQKFGFLLVPSSGASSNARRAGSGPATGTASPSPRRGGKVLPAPGR
jgi:hypothetical protein